MDEIKEDADCCEIWPKIMRRFDWMTYEDQPDMFTMPHITATGEKYFVNYCPSCGANARNRNVLRSRVQKKQ